MARFFYQEVESLLARRTNGRVKVRQVKVWETDTTTATYYEG
jgi:hypothetical protein